ncbi:core-2/I-Branching enzyme [Methylorubrum extorquens]
MSGHQIKIGYVILAHQHPKLVIRLAKLLLANGGFVSIHYDKNARIEEYHEIRDALQAHDSDIVWARRTKVGWGTWSIIEATLNALEALSESGHKTDYVHLMSGSDYPIKSLDSFKCFLVDNFGDEFIECADMRSETWVKGGLTHERYQYRHFFNWKTHRRLFDKNFAIQRRLKLLRKFPNNLSPHLGSQWWTLTWGAVQEVLAAGRDNSLVSFFRSVWIPDEMFIQTVVATSGRKISSKSNLTLYQFNDKGNPLVYYNDHTSYLSEQPFFFARKISPYADKLRDQIDKLIVSNDYPKLGSDTPIGSRTEHYKKFVERWAYIQPNSRLLGYEKDQWYGDLANLTKPIIVIAGANRDNIKDAIAYINSHFNIRAHGCLFDKKMIEFENGKKNYAGYQSTDVALRDDRRTNFLYDIIREDSLTGTTCFALPLGADSDIIDRLAWIKSVNFIFVHGGSFEAIASSLKTLNRKKSAKLKQLRLNKGKVSYKLKLKIDDTLVKNLTSRVVDYNDKTLSALRLGNCQLLEVNSAHPNWLEQVRDHVGALDLPANSSSELINRSFAIGVLPKKLKSLAINIPERALKTANEMEFRTLAAEVPSLMKIEHETPAIVVHSASFDEGNFIGKIIAKFGFTLIDITRVGEGSMLPKNTSNRHRYAESLETSLCTTNSISTTSPFVLVSSMSQPTSYVVRAIAQRESSLVIRVKGNLLRAYREMLVRGQSYNGGVTADSITLNEELGRSLKEFSKLCETHRHSFVTEGDKLGISTVDINLLKDDWLSQLHAGLQQIISIDLESLRSVVYREAANLNDPYTIFKNPRLILSSTLTGEDLKEQLGAVPRH